MFFLDTPELSLHQSGLVVRARRSQKKGDDSVVKLRPVVPAELSRSIRRLRASDRGRRVAGRIHLLRLDEGDSLDGPRPPAVSGKRPLSKLFSKDQRALFAAYAPEEIGLDDLSVLGPIFVLKLKFAPEGFARRLVVEMWLYPDGSRILELSTKCAPAEAFETAAEARAFLATKGVILEGEQQTKTRTALEYFARTGESVGAA